MFFSFLLYNGRLASFGKALTSRRPSFTIAAMKSAATFLFALSTTPNTKKPSVPNFFVVLSVATYIMPSRVPGTILILPTFYEHRRGEQTRRRYISRIESEASGTSLRVVARADDEDGRRGEFRDLALRGLATLRVTDRIVLTLHDIEGYRYAEIAEILDIAPGTVGSRLSRARERLAGEIRDLLGLDAEESLTPEHLYGHGRRGSGNQGRDCDEPLRNGKDS